MLEGEDGLFAARDVKQGEWIAFFGPMRQVTAEDGNELNYTISIRETGSTTLVYVTPIGKVGRESSGDA